MSYKDFANLPTIESLKFENLCFSHENAEPLLNHVDFEFPMNKIVWIRSESGKGKTTLLQIMAGLQYPQAGFYCINDQKVSEMSFEEFNPFRLAIGYAFDMGGLISNRTLYENLMLPLLYHKVLPHEDAQKKVLDILDFFKVKGLKDNRPAMVSGGVRKTICVVRSMILNPQVLLLDDPTTGLGPVATTQLIEEIKHLRELGYLNHVFISSNDEKFMSHFDFETVVIDHEQLKHVESAPLKKVVNL